MAVITYREMLGKGINNRSLSDMERTIPKIPPWSGNNGPRASRHNSPLLEEDRGGFGPGESRWPPLR